ncbi:MAG: XRE family transcriptional regulator [Ignavibacteria bacterium CG22_combo_CG10-13_8_21_14_all_37_15]|nr:MAG: XRE family transcriptional regulator [Ignavibacteria bacterium CG22_combo_CG10-13_8_21_14_all_37_15]
MKDLDRKLIIEQLDRKFKKLAVLKDLDISSKGWINAIRTGKNMSLVQLAKRLNITSVSAKEIEQREADKGITLRKLLEVAEALDCRFVYGFIPNEGSLEKTIDKRAYQVATDIVLKTSHTMKLEDQENSGRRIKKAIKDRAGKIKNEMPKYLWD